MIPLPLILVEFMLAFGGALLVANVAAIVKLRRDRNWPPYRPVGISPDEAAGLSRTATREHRIPSRSRLVSGAVIGGSVSLWSLATLLDRLSS
ncbi:MAG: hypothetical protein ABI912_00640 [Actinomycetota bacterium]